MDLAPADLTNLIDIGGTAALLWAAIYYLAKKLTGAYEQVSAVQDKRIEALEEASKVCEQDRNILRNRLFEVYEEIGEVKKKVARG